MKLTGIRVNKRLASLLTCVILLLSFLLPFTNVMAAPPSDDPDHGQVGLGAKDNGRQIELNESQVLVISLEGNPSTGYIWEVEQIDKKILRQKGKTEFEPESHLPGAPGLLGAPGKQILRFEAVAASRTTLRLVYRRPWEKGVKPARTFLLQVKGVGPFTDVKSPTPTPIPAVEPSVESPLTVSDQSAPGLPTYFNWCDLGKCTPVRDQGQCGSCWAFGTVGPLESNILIHDGVARDLSEQYLVSCNTDGWDCDGGWWAHDYHWTKIPPGEPEAGAVYETEFPYTARDDPCKPPHPHHEKMASWAYVDGQPYTDPSTAAIKQAIYDHGPVVVALCAGPNFQRYTGGIFQADETGFCNGWINHSVVLVGWDDSQGTWRLRNSWGTSWGESGYMNIKYGISRVGFNASYIVYGGGGSPDLEYGGHTVDDNNDGNSSGNNDGIVNCGETIELYVTLQNQGSETATGVNAAISISDPYVSFLHNTSSDYPDISSGDTDTNTDDFDLEVDAGTPNGHFIHFDLNITASNGGPWADSFDVPVVCSNGGGTEKVFLPLIVTNSSGEGGGGD
jgi:C1A family cysteine protease/predicted secreted protein